MQVAKKYTPTDLEKAIDHILSYPSGPLRWKATKDLYIRFNMSTSPNLTARQECEMVAKECAARREANINKFGSSEDKNSDLRSSLEMPSGLHIMLRIADPSLNTDDKVAKKNNAMKMFKAFPEFRTAEAV